MRSDVPSLKAAEPMNSSDKIGALLIAWFILVMLWIVV